MRNWIAIVLLGCGCSTVIPVYMVPSTDSPEGRAIVEEGVELLDVPVEFVDAEAKAVFIVEFQKVKDGNCGHAQRDGLCNRTIKTCTGPVFMGHEAGHGLGLKHVSDEDHGGEPNLMNPAPPNVNPPVTKEQKTQAQKQARLLRACKRGRN